MNVRTILRNITYSLTANVISFLVGVTVVAIVPKIVGVEDYGYFQLFLFFTGYVGLFHFGWADGILLRFAGSKWQKLDCQYFAGQIRLFVIFELILWGLFCLACVKLFNSNPDKLFVFICTGINAILMLLITFLRFILLSTNCIGKNSVLTLVERLIYFLAILCVLALDRLEFEYLIYSYIVSQIITLVICLFFCKKLIFVRSERIKISLKEAWVNISVGSKLLISNIIPMLIFGVLRFGVEFSWGISVFGKVSLLLSMISCVFIFINAISMVLLPSLRCETDLLLNKLYLPFRCGVSWGVLFCFSLVYPIKILAGYWLPMYADVFEFLPLIFPVCLYEGVINLLTSTYLKVFRLERVILWGNNLTLIISIILFITTIFCLKSLSMAMLSMTIIQAIRLYLLESRLSRYIGLQIKNIRLTELFVCIGFVCFNYYVDGWLGMVIYISFASFVFIISWKSYLEKIYIEFLAIKQGF